MIYNYKKFIMFLFMIGLGIASFGASRAHAAPSISVMQIEGKQLSPLQGKEISKMNLQVFRAGKWQAIPYQIDEKAFDPIAGSRRWVLQEAFSRRTDLPQGDGKLDEDEVLLFMRKDMGEKGTPESSAELPVIE